MHSAWGPTLTTPASPFTKAVTEASAASAQSCACARVHSVPGLTGLHRDPVTTGKTERQGRGEREKRLKRPPTHSQSRAEALSVALFRDSP